MRVEEEREPKIKKMEEWDKIESLYIYNTYFW